LGVQSRSKGAFVQANYGMLPRRRFNCQNIESEWGSSGAIFAEELPRDARKVTLFFAGDGFLGRAELASRRRSGLHFDKGDRPAVVSHQIDFALQSAKSKISPDHHVSVAPQIPIRIRFAANSRAPRPLLCRFSRRRRSRIRQALSCGPVHETKNCSSKNCHGIILLGLLCDLCALCLKNFARTVKKFLRQSTHRRNNFFDS
jgi:hypothetical protein